jgi:hypothetical protein
MVRSLSRQSVFRTEFTESEEEMCGREEERKKGRKDKLRK